MEFFLQLWQAEVRFEAAAVFLGHFERVLNVNC